MSDKFYVGRDLISFSDNGKYKPVSRITLRVDNENVVTAGDDTGVELVSDCPFATQEMADALLAQYRGYVYQAYEAGAVNIDPAAELGDGLTADGHYSVISRTSDDGSGYPSLSAPGEAEMEEEYPSAGPMTQEFNRKVSAVNSRISKTAEEIRLLVEQEVGELGDRYTELKVTLDGVTVTDASGTTRIKGSSIETDTLYVNAANILGTLSAGQINVSGAITWNDLSTGLQSTVNSAYAKGENAETIAKQIAAGTYSGGTFIDGTTIYSPVIQGAQIRATEGSGSYGVMEDDGFCIFDSDGNELIRLQALDPHSGYYTQLALGAQKYASNYAGRFLLQQIDAPAASETLLCNQSPTNLTAGFNLSYGKIKVLGDTFDFNGATVIGLTAAAVFS